MFSESIVSKIAPALWSVCDSLIDLTPGSGLVTVAQCFGKLGFYLKSKLQSSIVSQCTPWPH